MKRKAIVLGGVVALWGLIALVAVPALIKSAYAGESNALLNAILRGQATTSVERYLGLWRTIAQRVTIALVAIGGLVALMYPFRLGAARRLRAIAAALPGAGLGDLLYFAVFVGCIAGTTEALIALVRYLAFHLPTGSVTRLEVLWLSSAAATLVFVVITVCCFLIDRVTRARGAVVGALPFVLVSLTVFSAFERMSIGLHDVAIALLAAGAGVQIARVMADRPEGTRRLVRRAALGMGSALTVLAVVVALARQVNERFAVAALPAAPRTPDVLLIVWDAVRAPSLSAWGYSRETTPELERLAADGILFENAIAPAPWTAASHASFFTGRYPIDLSVGFRSPLDDAEPTLAEVLTANGYATAGFVGNRFYAGRGFGLDRGFLHYDDRVDIHAVTFLYTWWFSEKTIGSAIRILGNGNSPNRRQASTIIDKYLAWRSRHADHPYFAFINLFDAHDPYIPPPGWAQVFADRPVRQRFDGERISYTDQELDDLRTSYDECIHYLDSELGRLLEILRDDGTLDNTLVILTSDHGEEFGEHGNDLTTHGKSLYLPALHVPLVIRYPSLGSGERVQDIVSLRDLPATILDVIGLRTDPTLPGDSFLRRREPGSSTHLVFSMVDRYLEAGRWKDWPGSAGDMHSVFEGSKHFIRDARGREFLFETSTDPWEQKDLRDVPGQEADLERLRHELDVFLASGKRQIAGDSVS